MPAESRAFFVLTSLDLHGSHSNRTDHRDGSPGSADAVSVDFGRGQTTPLSLVSGVAIDVGDGCGMKFPV
jgi:hypothetical protein